ncbi:uncharacterized protein TNIN_332181 [Trichonephila inaurata madagascariensis]|uniref:Uncharacterized protein n=1 Tax=Trichonephila inaurata madagascariensis TaxID=2747483 RepID=A0A8X7C1R3_9ARAC|nr:uncharacterized protein TNIN_332181 [Trichonephila inaurata madagascariensis]
MRPLLIGIRSRAAVEDPVALKRVVLLSNNKAYHEQIKETKKHKKKNKKKHCAEKTKCIFLEISPEEILTSHDRKLNEESTSSSIIHSNEFINRIEILDYDFDSLSPKWNTRVKQTESFAQTDDMEKNAEVQVDFISNAKPHQNQLVQTDYSCEHLTCINSTVKKQLSHRRGQTPESPGTKVCTMSFPEWKKRKADNISNLEERAYRLSRWFGKGNQQHTNPLGRLCKGRVARNLEESNSESSHDISSHFDIFQNPRILAHRDAAVQTDLTPLSNPNPELSEDKKVEPHPNRNAHKRYSSSPVRKMGQDLLTAIKEATPKNRTQQKNKTQPYHKLENEQNPSTIQSKPTADAEIQSHQNTSNQSNPKYEEKKFILDRCLDSKRKTVSQLNAENAGNSKMISRLNDISFNAEQPEHEKAGLERFPTKKKDVSKNTEKQDSTAHNQDGNFSDSNIRIKKDKKREGKPQSKEKKDSLHDPDTEETLMDKTPKRRKAEMFSKIRNEHDWMEKNHISPKHELRDKGALSKPELIRIRKRFSNYLKGQYRSLEDETVGKSYMMMQDLKEVLQKRGISN